MLAFLQNLGLPETILIAVVAILIFGKRLPEVAAQSAVRLQRLRRSLADLRRESGIDAEIREAQRALREADARRILASASLPPARSRPTGAPPTKPMTTPPAPTPPAPEAAPSVPGAEPERGADAPSDRSDAPRD